MFVTYSPDGEAQRFEFRPGRVRQSVCEMIEKRYSKLAGEAKTYEMWKADVVKGGAAARRVLVWHLLSLQHPTIRIEDVDPYEDEVLVEFSRHELEEMRAAIAKSALGTEEKEAILHQLDAEIADADEGTDSGKANSKTSENATS